MNNNLYKDDYKYKISVIVPVYNTKEYLREAFNSIYNQTLDGIEVIAVDDGSTDGSLQELYSIKSQYPDLIIISQKNKKQGGARNTGLSVANGEYVYFLDSDDYINIDSLEKCYRIAQNNDLDAVFFQGSIFGDIEGRDTSQYIFERSFGQYNEIIHGVDFFRTYHKKIPFWNIVFILFKKKFLDNNDLLFIEDVFFEDVDFYYHIMQKNPRIMILKDAFYNRRYRHDSTMTSVYDRYRLSCKILIYSEIVKYACGDLEQQYKEDVARGLRNTLIECKEANIKLLPNERTSIIDIISFICNRESIFNSGQLAVYLDLYYVYLLTGEIQIPKEIEDNVKIYVSDIVYKVGLNNPLKSVGFYGIGKEFELIFELIKAFGELKSKTILLDRKTKDNKFGKVQQAESCNIDELATILITTPKYEDEIINQFIDLEYKGQVFGMCKDFQY